jgi:hypothetical protein
MSGRGKGRHSDRPSWADEGGTDLSALPSFWPEQRTQAVVAEASRPSWREPAAEELEPLWERWFERAVEEGLEEDLASLGRSLIRVCREQRWDAERRAECGWFDDGEAMLELALVEPEQAEARWRLLLDNC